MSEEIAEAAADLATVYRLRSERDAAHAKIRAIERAVREWAAAHRAFGTESQCSTCLALLRIADGTYQE